MNLAYLRQWSSEIWPEHIFRAVFLGMTSGAAILLAVLSYARLLPFTIEYFLFFSILYFLLALWRPTYAFLFLMSMLPLEIVLVTPSEWGATLRPYQWLALLLGGALGVQILLHRIVWPLWKWNRYDASLALVALGAWLSGMSYQGEALRQAVIFSSFFFLYILGRIFLKSVADVRVAAFFLVIPTASMFVWGALQNVLFLHDLPHLAVMPGRPNGTLPEPDWLGLWLIVALIPSVHWLKSILESKRDWRLLILPFFSLVGLFALLLMTVSRSAWLGAVAGLCMAGFGWWVRWEERLRLREALVTLQTLVLAFGMAVLLVETVPLSRFSLLDRAGSTATHLQTLTLACQAEHRDMPEFIERVEDLPEAWACRHINLEEIETLTQAGLWITTVQHPDPNVGIRAKIYQASLAVIQEHPLLGIGWGNIGPKLGVDERGASYNSSNVFLETWLGSGLLGLIGLVGFFALLFYRSVRLWHAGKLQPIQVTFMSMGSGFIVFNLFNAGLLLGGVWILFAAWVILLESPESYSLQHPR